MKFLPITSERIKVSDNWVGLDDFFWLKIVRHKKLFRKEWLSVELILTKEDNKFMSMDTAIHYAKRIITDFHDLIRREV